MKVKHIIIALVVAALLGLGGKFYFEKRVVDSFNQGFEQASRQNPYVRGQIGNASYSAFSRTLTLENLEFSPKNPDNGSGKLNIASIELAGANLDALDNKNIGNITLDTRLLDTLIIKGSTLSDEWGTYSKKLFSIKDPRTSQALLLFVADPEGIVKANNLHNSYDVLEFIGKQIAFKNLLIEGAELNLKGEAGEELGIAKVSMDRYELRDCADNMVGGTDAENIKVDGPHMKMLVKRADSKNTFLFGNITNFPEYIASGKFPRSQSSISGFEMTASGEGPQMSIKLADAKFEQVFDDVSALKFVMNGFEIPFDDFKNQIDPAFVKVLADNNIPAMNFDFVFDMQLDRASEEVSLNEINVKIQKVGTAELRTKLRVKGILEQIRALQPVLSALSKNPVIDGILGTETEDEAIPSISVESLQPLLVSAKFSIATDPSLEGTALKLVQVQMPQLTLEQFQQMRKQQAASAAMLLSAMQLPQLQNDVRGFIEKLGSLEITVSPAEPVDLLSLSEAGPAELQKLNITSVFKPQ